MGKRVLAIMLCAALLLGMVAVQAEETCAHANTSSEAQWYYCAFEAVDNDLHTVSGLRIRVTKCDDCGETIDEESLGEMTSTVNHDFNDEGVCVDCEYVYVPCAHANTYTEEYSAECAYLVDDQYHRWVAESGTRVVCQDCGRQVSKSIEETTEIEVEKHKWIGGECGECLFENPCTHSNDPLIDGGEETYYEPYDAAQYYKYYSSWQSITCGDCGEQLDFITVAEEESYEAHEFEGGYCVLCEAENTCAHENVVEEGRDYKNVSYRVIDLKQHERTHDVYLYSSCLDCGELVGTLEQAGVVQVLNHSYDSMGKCMDCGFESNCAHEETEVVTYAVYDSCSPYNATQHEVINVLKERTLCADCGYELGDKWLGTAVSDGYEPHEFEDDYGYVSNNCPLCGYVKTGCLHEDSTTDLEVQGDNKTYQQLDSQYHTVIGPLYERVWCYDCEEEVSRTLIEENGSAKEWHYFEDSVCSACGYENVCIHEDTEMFQFIYYDNTVTYQVVDGEYHLTFGSLREYTYCNDCGNRVSDIRIVSDNGSLQEYHDFENDVCGRCGYDKTEGAPTATPTVAPTATPAPTCAHENIGNTDDFLKNAVYTPIDASMHEGAGELWREVFCRDCLKWITIGMIDEEGTLTESHDFVEGVCYYCGYANTCTHANTHTEGGWNDSVYEAIDNQYHTHSGYHEDYLVCSDCGEFLDSTTPEYRTEVQDHWYDKNGVCRDCNHVNTCTHEDTNI
ncbi:MAG: hypothetical protein IJC56_12290, partial [Clostridia bacterium]|nr:hypothetical protein [Clostridia bacterium]